MYQIKNGVLYKDGKKTFVLGQSYYPSFHPCKFPVKPEDDRMGEMVKDLRMMAETGFNHVRFAALGDHTYDAEAKKVQVNSPFVDAMVQEAAADGLSVSMRLEGFSVNLRGFADAEILDQNGSTPTYAWCDFVRSCMRHPGILEDNALFARDLAAHFAKSDAMVGFQIYNEPKFPNPHRIYTDYNPHAVAAFRKYLVEKGKLTAEEAESYEPPRSLKEQTPEFWALWRRFSEESLDRFLKNAGDGARQGADLPVFTCLTSETACKTNCRRGVNAFADAKHMDFVGYTIYHHAWGEEYYRMCLEADSFQCAAEAEGKTAWCVELDSRTYIPTAVYNKGVYATVGVGVKGIIFYQWRGDQPVEGVPHPNSCGLLNYDGTKTENFDNAVAVNRWISSVNDLLMGARRACEGIGLLYSPYAAAYCDALQNTDGSAEFHNSTVVNYQRLYTELRRAGYTVTVTDAEHLKENCAGIKVLIVPDYEHLSVGEQEILDAFRADGGEVYANHAPGAPTRTHVGLSKVDGVERTYEEKVFLPPYTPYDLADLTGIHPMAAPAVPNLGAQVLQGADCTLVVLTNLSPVRKEMDAKLRVSVPFATAQFTAVDGEKAVEVCGEEISVRGMTDGGLLILR